MKPRQRYVRLSEGPVLVLPAQKAFVRQYSEHHGIPINQAARDIIQHAIECPFFNGNSSTGGRIAQSETT